MDAVHQILIVAHAIGDHVLSELWIAVILGHLHPLAEVVQFGIRHRWLLWQSGIHRSDAIIDDSVVVDAQIYPNGRTTGYQPVYIERKKKHFSVDVMS